MDIHCWWEPFHCSRQKGRSARLRLEKSSENKIIVKITEKSERKIGLVVSDNFVHIAKDKNFNYFGGRIREKKNIVSRSDET